MLSCGIVNIYFSFERGFTWKKYRWKEKAEYENIEIRRMITARIRIIEILTGCDMVFSCIVDRVFRSNRAQPWLRPRGDGDEGHQEGIPLHLEWIEDMVYFETIFSS